MGKNLYTATVSYYETDCMDIVHHSNYIRYFEDARIRYMHEIGCDVAEMQAKGLYIPNVDAYARYKKPLHFGDDFCVDVQLVLFTGSRMVFEYELFNAATNELSATGRTTHCFATPELKPISIKRSNPEYYERLMKSLAPNK